MTNHSLPIAVREFTMPAPFDPPPAPSPIQNSTHFPEPNAPRSRSWLGWLKRHSRFLIGGLVFAFLLKALLENGQTMATVQISGAGWACLIIALGFTLLAHTVAGLTWASVLATLGHPMDRTWTTATYLKTNIAKYLPGNVWHFYGRVTAAHQAGIPLAIAALSVLMEPLLLATAACTIALLGLPHLLQWSLPWGWILSAIGWIGILVFLHPRWFNPLLGWVNRLKQKVRHSKTTLQLDHYPGTAFLGEIGFLLLRGTGFLFACLAISPFSLDQPLVLYSTFSLAWLIGFLVPIPGGIGVFELVALTLLGNLFPSSQLLAILGLYRLVSTLAEAIGAGLALWSDRLYPPMPPNSHF
ncbi:MAG: lysylphosphatidylglycerol synthase domain-containing protein [Synechococcales bacterium]|nr:lysylphosphatidylglycerol synthase domain-containing protein [Synechococcales bacterium]